MGRLSIGEETSTPATPTAGITAFATVATPSLFRLVDDAGGVYTVSLLEKTQTFTITQTIAPTSTTVNGLVINMPTSSTFHALEVQQNGTAYTRLQVPSVSMVGIDLLNFDNSTGVGRSILVRRNNSAGTPAAGYITFQNLGGTSYRVWPDTTGDLRINNADPTNANDVAGTVVGDQTSWYALKENIRLRHDPATMLALVLQAKVFDYELKEDGYQNADGSKPVYTGLIITEEDRENNAWFAKNLGKHQTPALNERSLFGHLIGAIQAQQAQIEALTQRLTQLEARI